MPNQVARQFTPLSYRIDDQPDQDLCEHWAPDGSVPARSTSTVASGGMPGATLRGQRGTRAATPISMSRQLDRERRGSNTQSHAPAPAAAVAAVAVVPAGRGGSARAAVAVTGAVPASTSGSGTPAAAPPAPDVAVSLTSTPLTSPRVNEATAQRPGASSGISGTTSAGPVAIWLGSDQERRGELVGATQLRSSASYRGGIPLDAHHEEQLCVNGLAGIQSPASPQTTSRELLQATAVGASVSVAPVSGLRSPSLGCRPASARPEAVAQERVVSRAVVGGAQSPRLTPRPRRGSCMVGAVTAASASKEGKAVRGFASVPALHLPGNPDGSPPQPVPTRAATSAAGVEAQAQAQATPREEAPAESQGAGQERAPRKSEATVWATTGTGSPCWPTGMAAAAVAIASPMLAAPVGGAATYRYGGYDPGPAPATGGRRGRPSQVASPQVASRVLTPCSDRAATVVVAGGSLSVAAPAGGSASGTPRQSPRPVTPWRQLKTAAVATVDMGSVSWRSAGSYSFVPSMAPPRTCTPLPAALGRPLSADRRRLWV